MTAAAAVEIEARAEAARDRIRFGEIIEPGIEDRLLPGG
jgi:hypothetical protein